MRSAITTEICVVGGGPAGSAIARKLALLGHQVCLVEKMTFPRAHIGESLPPSILPVLDLFDLRHRIEAAGFYRPSSAIVHWSSHVPVEKSYSQEAGFQVDRGRFDQLLLEAAQAAGVVCLQPATAGRPISQGQQQWSMPVRSQGKVTTIQARFIVNATGKHSAFCRRPQHHTVTTLALYGYWRDTPFQAGESYVEAGAEAWFWGASLPDGTFNAAVFFDAQRDARVRSGDRDRGYRSRLAQTTFLKGCLEGVLTAPPRVCDASFFLADDFIGQDWIKVGDAAFAIDPLSAQGVQMAMMSAFQGAIVVHTLLTQPENTNAALSFYRHKLHETVTRAKITAAQFYAIQDIYPQNAFWQARSRVPVIDPPATWATNSRLFELSDPLRLSPAATLTETPVIQGDSIQLIPALHHPSLDTSVGYLGNIAIAPLLQGITPGQTVVDLMQRWKRHHDLALCWQLFQWCWEQNILVLAAPLGNPLNGYETHRHTHNHPLNCSRHEIQC